MCSVYTWDRIARRFNKAAARMAVGVWPSNAQGPSLKIASLCPPRWS
jgi:hypothetical protein